MGQIGYFSMEFALSSALKTYSGGLGVLAGDHVREAADMNLPLVAVGLFYRNGYFQQHLSQDGWQTESYPLNDPEKFMRRLPETVQVHIEGRDVNVHAWQYDVVGIKGNIIPVILLDTMGGNADYDERICDTLYGGSHPYNRITQEAVLGIGGVRMLRKLGYDPKVFHMNEGHAAFLTLELLKEYGSVEKVREHSVFTTHTPVAAGHDRFSYDLADQVLNSVLPSNIKDLAGQDDLSMTVLAMNMSRYTNAVAKRHAEVSRVMFPGRDIDFITNGVHSNTWTSDSFKRIFDKYMPNWKYDPQLLKSADKLSLKNVSQAHQQNKTGLVDYVNSLGGNFDKDTLTIGFARRFATYKRAHLVFSDIERLKKIGNDKIQLVFSGKSHPKDKPGKEEIQKVMNTFSSLGPGIPVSFIEDYDMEKGGLLTSGVDVWLNTPARPREASGTSGMKAAHNAVPNHSVLDGWWCEGHKEDITGWSIGGQPKEDGLVETVTDAEDANDLYDKLENKIIPLFYKNQKGFLTVMRNAISIDASYFNTRRMLLEYLEKSYKI